MDPWLRFRNLCQYYADCVKYSEKSQEYLFPNQLGKDFLLPRLPVNWHLKDEEFKVNTSSSDAYIRNLLLKASDEDELFIGYPLSSFISPEGFECLCPVMMFPVNIAVLGPGFTTGMKVTIDRRGISLNQDWIEYHIPRNDRIGFAKACEQSVDEAGSLDVGMVFNYMQAHFKHANIDPNFMQYSVSHSEAKDSLLNTAVMFVGTKTKYTKTLLSELHRIAREPDSVLDRTALAYVFREPCLPNEADPEIERRIPVSFTKRTMNAGQFQAVEESLNKPVVKVMGPPGTGKSFMSVNLIANEVLNGGSVLFTSKNHKAIHAIYDKAPDAVDAAEFPLVAFCTTPDNPTNADWQKSQKAVDGRVEIVEGMRGGKLPITVPIPEAAANLGSSALEIKLSSYRDAEEHINRYQRLRSLISRYERLLIEVSEMLSQVPVGKQDSPEFTKLLEDAETLLSQTPKRGYWKRFCDLLVGIIGRNMKRSKVPSVLSEVAPSLCRGFVSRKTLAKEARRLLGLLRYRSLIRGWGDMELASLKQEESELNYDALKEVVSDSLRGVRTLAQKAYVERMIARVARVEERDSIVARCKASADSVLKSMALDFMAGLDVEGKFDKPVTDFKSYLDVFPAWAATMLSLRRAAPCLPGVFSLAIIDEASQCEIPPMIPVLYRAQRVAIVGDPNQFPPVITLKESRDAALRRQYHIDGYEYNKYSYRDNNVFSVVPGKPVLLNEHFRCADGIAAYFNDEFYDGELSLCCETGRSGSSAIGGMKPGMMWIDSPGGDMAEMAAALEYLRNLKNNGFTGSIGVISPLRSLANSFKTLVAENKGSVPRQLNIQSQITTANGFQGGECDVILFLLGLNADRTHGQDWYITAAENRYIYNVSVSRAKALFVAFGDKRKVAVCGLSYIQKLVPESRPPRKVSVGPGEERLKIALQRSGIETDAQYPVLNRYLDLAIPRLKIDIEVDGQAWHLDRHGSRKADDIHRDIQLEAAGWKVMRFWHHEVVSDVASCVKKVADAIASANASV